MAYTVTIAGGGASFYEGAGPGPRTQNFTITRDAADAAEAATMTVQITFNAAAGFVNGLDFVAPNFVNNPATIAAGATSATFGLIIATGDGVEPDEMFTLRLFAGANLLFNGDFTIRDGAEPGGVGTPPVEGAVNDLFVIPDNGSVSGNVLFNNGAGGDVGGALRMSVAALNGSASAIGVPTVLPSGATVLLTSEGGLSYNPGSAFTYLPVGFSAVDSFTYTLGGGTSATVAVTINGVDNRDVLRGTGTLAGGLDNDTYVIDSAATAITERGGQGSDTVLASVSYSIGDAEIELLSTRTNSDTSAINLTGNFYSQTIVGNFGDNILTGGGGVDTMVGLKGNDLYAVGDSRAVIVEAAGEGDDTVVTGVSYTLGTGVSVEVLAAQSPAGTEALVLRGNEFAQTIVGNAGANTLDGGAGSDMLAGGGGADRFDFTTALGANNVDSIVDFQVGVDKIGLSTAIFGTFSAATFVASATASTPDQHILYNATTGQLFYDADGSGSGVAVLFALVTPSLALTSASFEVIGG